LSEHCNLALDSLTERNKRKITTKIHNFIICPLKSLIITKKPVHLFGLISVNELEKMFRKRG
jgi:hypothetical protein